MNNTFNILHNELGQAIRDSLNMIGIAIVLSIVVGGLIGLILYLTSNPLFFKNKIINSIAGVIVNIIRSLPLSLIHI